MPAVLNRTNRASTLQLRSVSRESMHDPPNAFAHRWRAEIQEKTDPTVRQLEVGSKLPQVNARDRLGRFDLDQQGAIDDDISAVRAV